MLPNDGTGNAGANAVAARFFRHFPHACEVLKIDQQIRFDNLRLELDKYVSPACQNSGQAGLLIKRLSGSF